MSKMRIVLTAAVLVLALSEVTVAGNKDQNDQPLETRQVADPAAGGATASQREWEYLTALQKCELLVDAEKTNCVDAVRKKYGQM